MEKHDSSKKTTENTKTPQEKPGYWSLAIEPITAGYTEFKKARWRPFIYIMPVLILLWVVGLINIWDYYMVLILVIISILSLIPFIIYLGFNVLELDLSLTNRKNEIRHHGMKDKKLLEEIEETHKKVYSVDTYQVPLTLVTLTFIVGWVFFFFSEGYDIVFRLPTGQISILFTRLNESHPIVLGFLGAYTVSLGTLLHRYVTKDMKASVFMSLTVRTWTVFFIIVVLTLIWGSKTEEAIEIQNQATTVANGTYDIQLLAISFIIGYFPNVGITIIKRVALSGFENGKAVLKAGVDKLVSKSSSLSGFISEDDSRNIPLSKIQGLNLWHQSRLNEEDIDSVQNLAMSDINSLVVNTRISFPRLLHWIDQAFLILYVGEKNVAQFYAAGIKTATGFECNYFARLSESERNKLIEEVNETCLASYLGREKCPSYFEQAEQEFIDSIDNKKYNKEIIRNIMISICDNDNYQQLWQIIHGSVERMKNTQVR